MRQNILFSNISICSFTSILFLHLFVIKTKRKYINDNVNFWTLIFQKYRYKSVKKKICFQYYFAYFFMRLYILGIFFNYIYIYLYGVQKVHALVTFKCHAMNSEKLEGRKLFLLSIYHTTVRSRNRQISWYSSLTDKLLCRKIKSSIL